MRRKYTDEERESAILSNPKLARMAATKMLKHAEKFPKSYAIHRTLKRDAKHIRRILAEA